MQTGRQTAASLKICTAQSALDPPPSGQIPYVGRLSSYYEVACATISSLSTLRRNMIAIVIFAAGFFVRCLANCDRLVVVRQQARSRHRFRKHKGPAAATALSATAVTSSD